MTTDWRALCVELLSIFDNYDDQSNLAGIFDDMKANKNDLLDRARTALAEPELEIPKNCWLDDEPGLCPSPCVFDDPGECVDNCTFATRLQAVGKLKTDCKYYRQSALAQPEPEGPTPQPIPVSERLPGPGDCDAEGRCWFSIDGVQVGWALEDWTYGCNQHRNHWLPAHALPLPS